MASSDKELEQQLMEAGNKLLNPPSSVNELLPLLDQVENCLSKVEQSPSESMQSALAPSQNALVKDQLFRHSNVDVKVAVASCISEITRITAPDAPYDDDQMKDVFHLIVSSFENLADKSSQSYGKRTSILETVAKVRSCVVMLDLECDALIIEMFQHFLNAIRDYHPENVFSSMEIIMTLVLDESEDISPELLSPLFASSKKDNEEVVPVARKLAEKVLEKCAAKVKPYLQHAVKLLGISLEDYSDIVRSICEEMSCPVEQNDHATDENKVEESKPAEASSDEAAKADIEIAGEAGSPKQADARNDTSPKSVVSNGVAQVGEDDSLADSCSLKKQDDGNHADQQKGDGDGTTSNAEPDVLDAEKAVNEGSELEQATKKKERKVNSSIKLAEPSESSHIDNQEEAQKLPDAETPSKDVPSSPHQEVPTDAVVSSENKRVANSSQPSSPKAQEGESVAVASLSGSGSIPDGSVSKKTGLSKKKDSLIKDLEPSPDDVPRKVSEGTSDSETKPNKRSARKAPARISNEEKASIEADESKKDSDYTNESEEKPVKQPSKKMDSSNNEEDGSSLKQLQDKKHRNRGKSTSGKKVTKNSTKDDDEVKFSSPKSAPKSTKDVQRMEETPKTDNKRMRTLGNEKASKTKGYDAKLIGLRIKVWWPDDREFYEGVISSYNRAKKTHKVSYDDGDTEILNLEEEKWERIEKEEEEEEEADSQSPDAASERPPKKKAKTITDQSSKQRKVVAPPSRGGGSSSKPKSATTKSGRKSKDVSKTDGKSMDDSKAIKKADDYSVGKAKDKSNRSGGKSNEVSSKSASKSKNDDFSKTDKSKEDGSRTPKASKSKQDTPKVTPNAKSKSSKSSSKSSVNGTGKLRSGSLKVKETGDKENSTDSGEAQESTKGKALSSSKGQGSEVKSGKKRRRA